MVTKRMGDKKHQDKMHVRKFIVTLTVTIVRTYIELEIGSYIRLIAMCMNHTERMEYFLEMSQ